MQHLPCTQTCEAIQGTLCRWVMAQLFHCSRKQKLSTRSSTEAELVAYDDAMTTGPLDLQFPQGTRIRNQDLQEAGTIPVLYNWRRMEEEAVTREQDT